MFCRKAKWYVCVAERHDIVATILLRIKMSCALQKGTVLCVFTLGSQNIDYFVGRQSIVRFRKAE
jgi:hypothetical protein